MDGLRKKIIYVDDVNYSLRSLRERLKQRYNVYLAQSADMLFSILNLDKPELVILDINMPKPDGFDIIKTLRANPRFASLPVIFLTGQYDRETVLKAINCGASDLVTKPFSDADLIDRIDHQLEPGTVDEYKPAILAVDDNPSILRTINVILHQKYRVYTLLKPEAMRTLLRKINPDLFLLDCNMPVLSGFDLVPQIRAFPRHKNTPIIFLTSDGTVDSLNAAVYFGAVDFLVKPVDAMALHDKLSFHTRDYLLKRHLWKF